MDAKVVGMGPFKELLSQASTGTYRCLWKSIIPLPKKLKVWPSGFGQPQSPSGTSGTSAPGSTTNFCAARTIKRSRVQPDLHTRQHSIDCWPQHASADARQKNDNLHFFFFF